MTLLAGTLWPLSVPADPPNVLFIAIDDLNDWTGVYGGHPQAKSPNLDALAKSGVMFRNAYCAAPACNPSRAALMTGLRPSSTGVYENPDPWRKALPDALTIPQYFRQHGYVAMGSGKIYHGSFPDPASWDDYWPSLNKQTPGDPRPDNRPLNGIPRTAHFDWGPIKVNDQQMGDAQVVDWVVGELNQSHDKPFFLACGLFRPHLPWYVPEKYFEPFPLASIQLPEVVENDLADVPPAGVRMAKPGGDHAKVIKHDQWKQAVQGYLASIYFSDTQLGRVLDALESSPYADNTIVVLWTDHGWHLGEKEHWRKFALWEEATRTPLIFKVPGVTKAGGVCTQAVSLLDIYPTLNELCGLPAKEDLEGQSLVHLLKDPSGQREQPAITTHQRNNHAVRSDRYRYIRYADGTEEFYDHQQDPQEATNLAGNQDYAELIEQHQAYVPKKNVPQVKP